MSKSLLIALRTWNLLTLTMDNDLDDVEFQTLSEIISAKAYEMFKRQKDQNCFLEFAIDYGELQRALQFNNMLKAKK